MKPPLTARSERPRPAGRARLGRGLLCSWALLAAELAVLPGRGVEAATPPRTFHLDAISGDDARDGRTPATAWRTLERAGRERYGPDDSLLLRQGCVWQGSLHLQAAGAPGHPFVLGSYAPPSGPAAPPRIDARGRLAAIHIENGSHLVLRDLELTADAGEPVEPAARTARYGVLITATRPGDFVGIELRRLKIHHIFATENVPSDGQNPTSNKGLGIAVVTGHRGAQIRDVTIAGCDISMTGHTGIRAFGKDRRLRNLIIEDNHLRHIGGPGMVPGRCEHVVVRRNVTDHTGSGIDPRMHHRGSGIWPWTCDDVLIEHNRFLHAFGKYDSHGAHIDFNCRNVLVQYNLSLENHGGFVEILGNDEHCCYRYNISINDGWRIKGRLGAKAEGNTLWTSGFVGKGRPPVGPRNSYIYNNTIYVKAGQRTCFSIVSNTDGLYIANNIFHLLGPTADDSRTVKDPRTGRPTRPRRVVFENNLYVSDHVLPEGLSIQDTRPLFGDAAFRKPGGTEPEDYVPTHAALVRDQGVAPRKLPGDTDGPAYGLTVKRDFFGRPIRGRPELGAVELP